MGCAKPGCPLIEAPGYSSNCNFCRLSLIRSEIGALRSLSLPALLVRGKDPTRDFDAEIRHIALFLQITVDDSWPSQVQAESLLEV